MPASPTELLSRPLAVVAHDAGAANILFAWLNDAAERNLRVTVAGPAERIWRVQFPNTPVLPSIEDALDGATTLISGTGWASDMEHRARTLAADRGIRSIAVIDHWVNFAARFERNGARQLPDEIWVGDEYAADIARREFPAVRVVEHRNSYLDGQARTAGPVPDAGDILFVAEPARSDWGRDKQGEFQALDYFAAHRSAAGIARDVPLRLRPHPSDPPGKYDGWIAGHDGASLDRSDDMAAALAPARYVVGLNSFALTIALAAGRTAISSLPPWGPDCVLPHDDIVRLRDVV